MTDEEQNPQVHHMTAKAARNALAGKRISQESYAAVLRDELSLEEAKQLGRDASPAGPAARVDKSDRSRLCMCGCGNRTKGGRFQMGHDMRLHSYAKEYLRGERELTDEQMEYVERSGKLERAKAQVEKEEGKRKESIARKTERQRVKEGEAERKAKK